MIRWKRIALWLGILATIPASLLLGFYIADVVYMRFIFKGDREDFTPGDSFGILFYAVLFTVLILIPAMLGWWRLYRKMG